jgi:maltooligosyltrehalose trehalohydrolase
VVFSQNHDHVGNRMNGERSSTLYSFEMQKLLVTAVMVSPYLPLLFMGEEWSETNSFLYFVDHSDLQLMEAVRNGRKNEFADFHSPGEMPDPLDKNTFLRSKLQWNLILKDEHKIMLNFYREIISIRKNYDALSGLNRKKLEVDADRNAKTIVLRRWSDKDEIICLMNFSEQSQTCNFPSPEDQWKEIFNSADERWKGPGKILSARNRIKTISAQSAIIYLKKND